MNSELTFLMELFLEDELSKEIKKKIIGRIKEIEARPTHRELDYHDKFGAGVAVGGLQSGLQALSTQRLLANHPDLVPKPPEPVTSAAAEALQKRAQLMQLAGVEKPEAGRKSPRKA